MKIYLFRRKWCTAAGCLLLALGMFWIVCHPAAVGAAAQTRQLPIYSVKSSEKKVAISFDAAWGNEDTETLIEILNRYHVKATFFLVGQWVDKYPESVKALAAAGNEIGNHSDTHPHFTQCSQQQITQEIQSCNNKIEALTGVCPTIIRCPYGDYNDTAICAVRALGMEPVQWDVDSLDWKGISAQEITKRVLDRVQCGSIVLFHNAAEHTPEALPGILEQLQSQGYTFCTISEMLLQKPYTINVNGCQCPA